MDSPELRTPEQSCRFPSNSCGVLLRAVELIEWLSTERPQGTEVISAHSTTIETVHKDTVLSQVPRTRFNTPLQIAAAVRGHKCWNCGRKNTVEA